MRVLSWSVVIALLGTPVAVLFTHTDRTAPRVHAQPSTDALDPGVVSGIVVGEDGAVVQGVMVKLLLQGREVTAVITDAHGRFRFAKVPPGLYAVVAARDGQEPGSVLVAVNNLPGVSLRLTLGIHSRDVESPSVEAMSLFTRPQTLADKVAGAPARGDASATSEAPSAQPLAQAMRRGRMMLAPQEFNTASYARIDDNRFRRVADEPISTFSTDVDTASYSNVRRFLNRGTLPPADAVRVEELVNYFRFPYAEPRGDTPLAVTTEIAACPWNTRHRLALVGMQARRDDPAKTPARNLVFLLDVSGSMMPPDRLPLVKRAMRMLVDTLTARDRVAIVVYAGASGLALPSTAGDCKADIHHAIDQLASGGSTNGAAGITLAYDTAAASFVKGGVNRVILATDGDFNVGVTSEGELTRLIEQERERGIFLSVLGVGDDNLNDSTMEKLADRGNGNYAYLDSLDEARRALVAEAGSTLVTVAKDVKIQIEFNPHMVVAYRLVGYENRLLNRQDFNDDRKDAGDIGAGRTVTALYEIVPPGEPLDGPPVDPLKYQQPRAAMTSSRELMTVKVRYKKPDESVSQVMSVPVDDRDRPLTGTLGFAAAVAEFGMLLRGSEFRGDATWSSVQTLARQHRADDVDGYRAEFVRLVDLAATLQAQETPQQSR